ncbi:expressed unknown protein [Seminavis robusta]|uniref:Transmembrane protein n=1 Tax=Seminavis robusta TaxID=568900 RepID=A0A9N8ET63_9STRA|nr:expressed unknown protein [Seminavis robusta]|eukprot:Sro2041_g312230.1 n/a (383) ;mRNA; f:6096-7244
MPPISSVCYLKRETRRSLAITLAIFSLVAYDFAFVFLLILPLVEGGVWSSYDSGHCEGLCENSHQCDHTMAERPVIQQPANTWTNLAFILVGLWPIVAIRQDISTIVFLLVKTFVGISSFVFHASITTFWQHLDAAAVQTSLCTLVFHGIHCVSARRISWAWLAPINLATAIVLCVFKKEIDDEVGHLNTWIFFVSVLLFLACCLLCANGIRIFRRRQPVAEEMAMLGEDDQSQGTTSSSEQPPTSKWKSCFWMLGAAMAPMIIFAGAVVLNRFSKNRSLCDPTSPFQAHAVWHVLNAIASLLVWLAFDNYCLTTRPSQVDDDDDWKVSIKEEPASPPSIPAGALGEIGRLRDEFHKAVAKALTDEGLPPLNAAQLQAIAVV